MSVLSDILIQTLYYGVVMILSIGVVGFLLKGFFWAYVKVRMSFGRLVLVKIRGINRDYYASGDIEENFLVYTDKINKKKQKRININDNSCFYKSLGITWIDVDAQTNNICKPDYTISSGFDAVKYNNLYIRALFSPQIMDKKEQIILVLLILCLLIGVGSVVLSYMALNNTAILQKIVVDLSNKMPTIIGGGAI
jgi:hypothetical protein